MPRVYEFKESLPKTAVGKILRRVLIEEEKESNHLQQKNQSINERMNQHHPVKRPDDLNCRCLLWYAKG